MNNKELSFISSNDRILYYGASDNLGGIETYLYNLAKFNGSLQEKIDYLTTSKSICYQEFLTHKGSEIYKIPSRKPNPIKFYWELFKFFKKHKEHKIVHFFLQSASCIEPVLIAKLFGKKIVVDSRSDYKSNKKLTLLLHRLNKKLLPIISDTDLAISDKAGKSMFNKNYQIINSGIDAEEYIFNNNIREKYREKFKLGGKFVLGHVGRFTYEKNHDFLIDVFCEVNKSKPDSVLLLIGEGEYKNRIIKKVKEKGLGNKVIFLGNRSDVPNILQAIDIFVFPSHFEGLGRVLIEAQATGLKTVLSNNIPNEVNITNLATQLPLDSVSTWVNTIINSDKSYERLNMYRFIYDNDFDVNVSVIKLVKVYKHLLNKV